MQEEQQQQCLRRKTMSGEDGFSPPASGAQANASRSFDVSAAQGVHALYSRQVSALAPIFDTTARPVDPNFHGSFTGSATDLPSSFSSSASSLHTLPAREGRSTLGQSLFHSSKNDGTGAALKFDTHISSSAAATAASNAGAAALYPPSYIAAPGAVFTELQIPPAQLSPPASRRREGSSSCKCSSIQTNGAGNTSSSSHNGNEPETAMVWPVPRGEVNAVANAVPGGGTFKRSKGHASAEMVVKKTLAQQTMTGFFDAGQSERKIDTAATALKSGQRELIPSSLVQWTYQNRPVSTASAECASNLARQIPSVSSTTTPFLAAKQQRSSAADGKMPFCSFSEIKSKMHSNCRPQHKGPVATVLDKSTSTVLGPIGAAAAGLSKSVEPSQPRGYSVSVPENSIAVAEKVVMALQEPAISSSSSMLPRKCLNTAISEQTPISADDCATASVSLLCAASQKPSVAAFRGQQLFIEEHIAKGAARFDATEAAAANSEESACLSTGVDEVGTKTINTFCSIWPNSSAKSASATVAVGSCSGNSSIGENYDSSSGCSSRDDASDARGQRTSKSDDRDSSSSSTDADIKQIRHSDTRKSSNSECNISFSRHETIKHNSTQTVEEGIAEKEEEQKLSSRAVEAHDNVLQSNTFLLLSRKKDGSRNDVWIGSCLPSVSTIQDKTPISQKRTHALESALGMNQPQQQESDVAISQPYQYQQSISERQQASTTDKLRSEGKTRESVKDDSRRKFSVNSSEIALHRLEEPRSVVIVSSESTAVSSVFSTNPGKANILQQGENQQQSINGNTVNTGTGYEKDQSTALQPRHDEVESLYAASVVASQCRRPNVNTFPQKFFVEGLPMQKTVSPFLPKEQRRKLTTLLSSSANALVHCAEELQVTPFASSGVVNGKNFLSPILAAESSLLLQQLQHILLELQPRVIYCNNTSSAISMHSLQSLDNSGVGMSNNSAYATERERTSYSFRPRQQQPPSQPVLIAERLLAATAIRAAPSAAKAHDVIKDARVTAEGAVSQYERKIENRKRTADVFSSDEEDALSGVFPFGPADPYSILYKSPSSSELSVAASTLNLFRIEKPTLAAASQISKVTASSAPECTSNKGEVVGTGRGDERVNESKFVTLPVAHGSDETFLPTTMKFQDENWTSFALVDGAAVSFNGQSTYELQPESIAWEVPPELDEKQAAHWTRERLRFQRRVIKQWRSYRLWILEGAASAVDSCFLCRHMCSSDESAGFSEVEKEELRWLREERMKTWRYWGKKRKVLKRRRPEIKTSGNDCASEKAEFNGDEQGEVRLCTGHSYM